MQFKKLGVGIIGCGWVAEEHLKAYQHDPRSKVKALASRRKESAQRYREKYGLDCSVSTNYEEMLARKDIDIVVICTPHDRHTDAVIAAAKAGKHIVIEKPVAITLTDMRKQQQAIRKAGVKSLVSFVLRWNPLLQTIAKQTESNVLGDVFMVNVAYLHRIWVGKEKWLGIQKHAGTSLLSAGCHAVDAMRWFARSEAQEVSAYQVKTCNPNDYPGTITVNVKFADGKIGNVISCFDAHMPYKFNIGVYGTKGSIQNNEFFMPEIFPGQNNFLKMPCALPDSGDVAHHPFLGEATHFLDAIEKNRRPIPDIEDAAKTHEICFAADLSAEANRPVKIKELAN